MRKMGIEALYRRKNTSKRYPEHVVHPYLLRGLLIDRPNQVWATDFTCVPHGQRLCVPVFVDGLAHPQGAGLPPLQPSWRTSLSRRCRRLSTYTASRYLQHRSGLAVHRRGFFRAARATRNPHQHGRQGLLARLWILKYEDVSPNLASAATSPSTAPRPYTALTERRPITSTSGPSARNPSRRLLEPCQPPLISAAFRVQRTGSASLAQRGAL